MPFLSQINRFFTVLTVFMCVLAYASSAAAVDFTTDAKQAIMLDYDTAEVLFEKNADEQMAPSSMTKLMTIYVTFDLLKRGSLKLDDKFLVSEKAWRKGGSKMFVEHKSSVSVDQLLHGIIVQSGNDACIVLAEGISSSEEAFAEEMNQTAEKLGMKNSHFRNATGWPDDEHYSTAHDLAILSYRLIKDFPEYYELFGVREYTYNGIKQPNRNWLLTKSIGVDGLKTGHTEAGGYGIAVSAVQDGRRVITVVNGLSSDKTRMSSTQRLLRHGFRDFEKRVLYAKGEAVEQADVWMGKKTTVPLVSQEDISFLTSRHDKKGMEVRVVYDGPIPAPIEKGDKLATLKIRREGLKEVSYPLVAGEDVGTLSYMGRMIEKAKHYVVGE